MNWELEKRFVPKGCFISNVITWDETKETFELLQKTYPDVTWVKVSKTHQNGSIQEYLEVIYRGHFHLNIKKGEVIVKRDIRFASEINSDILSLHNDELIAYRMMKLCCSEVLIVLTEKEFNERYINVDLRTLKIEDEDGKH